MEKSMNGAGEKKHSSARFRCFCALIFLTASCGTPVKHSGGAPDAGNDDALKSCGNGLCETEHEDYIDCPEDCEVECLHDSHCVDGEICVEVQCVARGLE